MKVVFNNSRIATATFTIANQETPADTDDTTPEPSNPKTVDPVNMYIIIFILSIVGLASTVIYTKKTN